MKKKKDKVYKIEANIKPKKKKKDSVEVEIEKLKKG
jgi:hypothetical protein